MKAGNLLLFFVYFGRLKAYILSFSYLSFINNPIV